MEKFLEFRPCLSLCFWVICFLILSQLFFFFFKSVFIFLSLFCFSSFLITFLSVIVYSTSPPPALFPLPFSFLTPTLQGTCLTVLTLMALLHVPLFCGTGCLSSGSSRK